jgi:hypothetical protein
MEKCDQVFDVGVNTAIRNESQEVEAFAFGFLEAILKGGIFL